jgi:transglutaminase-like putative cysteine protease
MKFLGRFLLTVLAVLSLTLLGAMFFPDVMEPLQKGVRSLISYVKPWSESVYEIDFTGLRGSAEPVEEGGQTGGLSGEGVVIDASVSPYYEMLNDSEKSLYEQMYANAQALNASFTLEVPLERDAIQSVFQAVFYDHPELFWLGNTYSYQYSQTDGQVLSMTLAFNETAENIDASKAAFAEAANAVIAGASAYETDYQKEVYVHDALREMSEYDLNASLNQSAYSLLVNHRTVCAGYARSFQYIMNQLGIPTYYVVGTSEGQDHAWNMVLLDGAFYNVDVTWDDAASDQDPYYFFNLSDAAFAESHTRTGLSEYLPACTSDAYSHLEDSGIWQLYHFVKPGE